MRNLWRSGSAWAGLWACVLAASAAAAPAPGGGARPAGVLVRCESIRLRSRACPAASDANVRIVQVLGGRCLAGLTWFYDRRAIHVRGGCRAVFLIGGDPPIPAKGR
jgi:hypothetical protein